ncbi:MAG: hypothetical protein KDA81_18900 [Planctomycetaceae bacterium]|nr:hypothetical protein [Planctomycetaceae bacterium]
MIAWFVLKLAAGITFMWWLMPRRDVTDGFFRIQMRVVLGLSVLAALLLTSSTTWAEKAVEGVIGLHSSAASAEAGAEITGLSAKRVAGWLRSLAVTSAVIAYFGSVFWALGRRLPGNICIHLLTLISVTWLSLHAGSVPGDVPRLLQFLSAFSTAGVLGSVTIGMLLGHWYLTTPTMSIQPLYWFNKAIVTSAVLRAVGSGWAVMDAGLATIDLTEQIWLGIRWIGGIAAPALAALMVWRILKHRNTQSATGVLFAALILVFMGEMAAALLEGDTQIPW